MMESFLVAVAMMPGIHHAPSVPSISSQPRVAKIESGGNIGLDILRRYTKATGSDLVIDFAVHGEERRV